RLRDEGQEPRRDRGGDPHGGAGRRLSMELDAANTAIVLDSTADFPDARERFPNWRVVALYVRFGEQSYRDYVEVGPDEVYARLTDAPERPRTAAPAPGASTAVYEELTGRSERVLSLHLPPPLPAPSQAR